VRKSNGLLGEASASVFLLEFSRNFRAIFSFRSQNPRMRTRKSCLSFLLDDEGSASRHTIVALLLACRWMASLCMMCYVRVDYLTYTVHTLLNAFKHRRILRILLIFSKRTVVQEISWCGRCRRQNCHYSRVCTKCDRSNTVLKFWRTIINLVFIVLRYIYIFNDRPFLYVTGARKFAGHFIQVVPLILCVFTVLK
jgi:hypothetical protein